MKPFARRHPIAAYFVMAYAIAWIGSIAAVAPGLARGEAVQLSDGLLMFAAMLAGPSIAGITMTALVDGRAGLRDLRRRMWTWRVAPRWYAACLFFPAAILAVDGVLSLGSPAFAPSFALMGIAVGLLAGFFEEIGWTGYAFPRMSLKYGALAAAVYLGLFHSTWHVVADYLGSSAALGAYWLPHFLAFMTLATTATRVLIAWVYLRTQSVLLAQLMHASSTGCLFMLTPTGLTPAADTLWYAAYAIVVCVAVAVVVAKDGRTFGRARRG